MKEKAIRLVAPAKVNLFLKILGKRSDGYHEIFSLFQPISLSDEVRISIDGSGGGVRLTTDSPTLPIDDSNIACRAAKLFLSEIAREGESVAIDIKKRIPIGAGLGGGSTDAAAVLMGLNGLFGSPLSEEVLTALGGRLGSDVPFFILKSPALAAGRGELLERVELPKIDYVLLNPGYEVSTARVYANLGAAKLDLTKCRKDINFMYSTLSQRSIEDIAGLLINDLEAVTAKDFSEIALFKRELLKAGARGALMSGSGPTVFGIFDDAVSARRAFESLKDKVKSPARIFIATGL